MQLADRGTKVAVIDKGQLGSGSTGRAAGLLGQLRGNSEHTRMLMDGVEIVRGLEQRANVEIFVQTGSMRIAETPERVEEIRSLVKMGESIDFDISHLPIEEVANMLPHMRTDDLLDACYCPTDGHLQPAELVTAYTKIGRELGVVFKTDEPVQQLLLEGEKVTGVKTSLGEYHAPIVINAGGPWSYLNAALANTTLPTAALTHYYLTTRPHPDHPVDTQAPAIRDRELRIYARSEAGGLIVGMYVEEPELVDMAKLPKGFDMSSMKAKLDSMNVALLMDSANKRFPWIGPKTPMTMTAGIMTFTPDGRPFCGHIPEVEGLYHCSGFSGHGIVQSPTIGLIMAEIVLDGSSQYDISSIEADRYYAQEGFTERSSIEARCVDMAGNYYGKVEKPVDVAG